MKKERIIKISILSVVFVLALIVFSYITNRGSSNMTADMGSPTIPTLSFTHGGKEVNMLIGYKQEMPAIATRDAILPFGEDGVLKINIQSHGNKIGSLLYEIYSLDGEEKLKSETIDGVEKTVKIKVDRVLKRDQEGLLKITLTSKEKKIYYYTRIVRDNSYHVEECLKFAEDFHNNALKKEHEDIIKKVLETNETSKNNSLQHVNIHSDLNHVLWGTLKPKRMGKLNITVTEAKKAYTSILLRYQVQCKGDENKSEIYHVQEFFKVLYKNDKCYLLEYDRVMEEKFDPSNEISSKKGLALGIANEKLSYKVSDNGKQVAFVQAGELWSYNQEKHTVALLFSFVEAEEQDIRNYTDKYLIKIHKIDDEGNVTFSACGYMNRGIHEGETGSVVYYYDASENVLEEKCFVRSTAVYPVIEKEFAKFLYFNREKEQLYLPVKDNLIVNEDVLLKDISEKGFVSSDDGQFVAYCEKDKIMVLNLETGKKWDIAPEEGQILMPIGFVEDDFVYGISSEEMTGQDVFGNQVQAMRRLEIRDSKQQVIKVYEKADCDILEASIEGTVIRLRQGRKNGNLYVEVEEDHITNNESGQGNVSLKSYWTDLKQTQYRLVFSEELKNKNPRTLKPKLTLQENELVLEVDEKEVGNYYYVYGHGMLVGAFEDTGKAVVAAESKSGVVVSSKQNYLWESDNKVAWYRNFDIDRFAVKEGENSLTACVRKVLAAERKTMEEGTNLDIPSAEALLASQLETEVICLQGNSVKDICYLVSRGIPVIAIKRNASAVLVIGYDAQTVTFADPMSGTLSTQKMDKLDANTFIAYIK